MSPGLELDPEFLVIVNFTIERDDNVAAPANDRLIATFQVDNFEASGS